MNEERRMIYPLKTDEIIRLPFYVTGIGSLKYQHKVLRPEGLSDYQLLYIMEGQGFLRILNKEYKIGAGMGFYFKPGVEHEYYAIEEPWSSYWVMFNGYGAEQFPALLRLDPAAVFYVNHMDRLDLLHREIYAAVRGGGVFEAREGSWLLYHLLLELDSCISSDAEKSRPDPMERLREVIKFMESHLSEDMTLEELAAIVSVSPQHLCRLFRQGLNMRPFEYLTRCRIQEAKSLLSENDSMKLAEIANSVGFHDASYFCAVFREYEGVSPNQFRLMQR